MIMDFHTHTFPDKIAAKTIEKLSSVSNITPFADGTVKGLSVMMGKSGVDLSVVLPVATKPEQFKTINETAQAVNREYDGKIISFGGIHPDSLDYKRELDEIKQMGLIGIKLHPDYQKVYIDDERYMKIVDYASELDLVTVVHAGVDVGYPQPVHCTPQRSRKLIDAIHPKKFVLAHMGGFDMWDDVESYLAGQDIYFDTAYTFDKMGEARFLRLVHLHGIEKILFATDSPWCGQKESVEWIKSSGLTQEEQQMIFSENAKKLLNL